MKSCTLQQGSRGSFLEPVCRLRKRREQGRSFLDIARLRNVRACRNFASMAPAPQPQRIKRLQSFLTLTVGTCSVPCATFVREIDRVRELLQWQTADVTKRSSRVGDLEAPQPPMYLAALCRTCLRGRSGILEKCCGLPSMFQTTWLRMALVYHY